MTSVSALPPPPVFVQAGAIQAFLRNGAGVAALLYLAFLVGISLAAPLLYPDDPLAMVARPFLWPGQNLDHPLGTDSLGRDVAAGIIWGGRVSLLVGVSAMLLGVATGVVIGALAGYFGDEPMPPWSS